MSEHVLKVEEFVGEGLHGVLHARLYVDAQPRQRVDFRFAGLDMMRTPVEDEEGLLPWLVLDGVDKLKHQIALEGLDAVPSPVTVVPQLDSARAQRSAGTRVPPPDIATPGAVLARF